MRAIRMNVHMEVYMGGIQGALRTGRKAKDTAQASLIKKIGRKLQDTILTSRGTEIN